MIKYNNFIILLLIITGCSSDYNAPIIHREHIIYNKNYQYKTNNDVNYSKNIEKNKKIVNSDIDNKKEDIFYDEDPIKVEIVTTTIANEEDNKKKVIEKSKESKDIAQHKNSTQDDTQNDIQINNTKNVNANFDEFKLKNPLDLKSFVWPLYGKIIQRFSTTNEGINIVAPEQSKIIAAFDGKVLFSDNIDYYGYLIILKHPNGLLTGYAHNSRNLVKKGDNIKKGQVIAIIGKSGKVKTTQLHFSISNENGTVDPEKPYIKK